MPNWAGTLVALVFGSIGVANIVQYAPTAIPKLEMALKGESSVPSGLVIALLVCLGLTIITGTLAMVFCKERK